MQDAQPAPAAPTPTPTPGPPARPSQPAATAGPRLEEVPELPRDVPLTSLAIEEVGPVTPDTGVADVLLGSIALVAAMLAASLVTGALVGALLVYVKHRLGFGGPDTDADAHVSLAIGKDDRPR